MKHSVYTISGLLPPDGILPGAKFTLRPTLAFSYIGSRHQPNCGVVQGMELQNFRRGRHLYSVGRPLRLASAHIVVVFNFFITGFLFCLVPCGRLSWLFISFWAHVNIMYRRTPPGTLSTPLPAKLCSKFADVSLNAPLLLLKWLFVACSSRICTDRSMIFYDFAGEGVHP